METICDGCGAANAPGSEFCSQCDAFLAWEAGSTSERPPGAPGAGAASRASNASVAPRGGATAPPDLPAPAPPTSTARPGTPSGSPSPASRADPAGATTATTPTMTSTTVVAPAGETCPTCALVAEPGRRFCAHCGFGFAGSIPVQPAAPSASWGLSPAEQDRAARRAYRRSLPPLYRWRRVLVGGLTGALVVAGALVVRHPVAAVRDAWFALDHRYVKIAAVSASVVPPSSTAPGSDPAALVDGSDREWTQTWAPTGTGTCGAAPGTADIVLSFPPTRVRQVQVVPGLAPSNPARLLQPVPQRIGITFPGQPCRAFTLDAEARRAVEVDSGQPVTSVSIGITEVRPNGPADAPLTSVTEIIVRSFPR